MKRYMFLAGVVLLVSCGRVYIPITRSNSQITLPHYSIVVPPDRGWRVLRPDEKNEVAVVQAKVFEGDAAIFPTYRMRFVRNEVLDGSRLSWSAREVAEEFRNIEKQIMIKEGVRPGAYKLGDVVMGEERVADKKFYTMRYTVSDGQVNQTASLYLHFPLEEKNRYFMVIHYSETVPLGAAIAAPFHADFLETLKSLRITE